MFVLPAFPENRRSDPKRQSELRVYSEIAKNPIPGLAIYGAKALPSAPEIDFALWVQKEARVGMEVKGGRYTFQEGEWVLRSVEGPQPVDSPVLQARDSAMSFKDAVKESLGRKIYVVAVLVFPDMDPDQDIMDEAGRQKVTVLFGTRSLVDRMLQSADTQEIIMPPTPSRIQEEAQLFIPGVEYPTPGMPARQPCATADQLTETDILARHVVIQNAGVVNIYTAG